LPIGPRNDEEMDVSVRIVSAAAKKGRFIASRVSGVPALSAARGDHDSTCPRSSHFSVAQVGDVAKAGV
jgi:hypothetical protein